MALFQVWIIILVINVFFIVNIESKILFVSVFFIMIFIAPYTGVWNIHIVNIILLCARQNVLFWHSNLLAEKLSNITKSVYLFTMHILTGHLWLVTQIANQPITWQQLNAFRHLDVVKTTCWSSTEHQNGEERGFKWLNVEWLLVQTAGLSISQTADLLGSSHSTISRVYREWSEKEKISSEWQLCGRTCLVDVRGQRRMDRLDRDDRKSTVTQITIRYNQGMKNTISEHTTRQTLKQMGSSSRRPHRCRSCQIRTAHGGYNSHRITKTGQ